MRRPSRIFMVGDDVDTAHYRTVRLVSLLSTDAGHRLNSHHRRRVPFAGEGLGLRAIETHAHVECPLRSGQPVGFLVFAGALVLEVKVERPVRVGLERHVTADRETIEHVRHLEAFAIVERD